MSSKTAIPIITLLILLAALAGGAQASTVTASGGTISSVGQSGDFPITVDTLPTGLSGFNITISLGDPSKAEIVAVTLPPWAPNIPGIQQNGSVPADSVWIKVADFGNVIGIGATNVNLGTVTIRGDATGTTTLQVALTQLHNELGNQIPAAVIPGIITIGTPTTVPTTTPTTTATTTVPTTAPAGFGTVFVTSYPTGASVLVDGVVRGKTNAILPGISAGVRTFTVMKDGYQTVTFPVNVPVGGIVTPPKVYLVIGTSPTTAATTQVTTVPTTTSTTVVTTVPTTSPTTSVPTTSPGEPPGSSGSLWVISMPVGAAVQVDGEFRGYAPNIVVGLAPGSHELTVSVEGYRTEVRTFSIFTGRVTYVPVFLIPDVGQIASFF
ncbi:MAG TPA: PEGA domain-containing protein [Methanoregulaceae archaeon]|nr:PEGA domain-containing protein [Methanoregulaceae archaeon]